MDSGHSEANSATPEPNQHTVQRTTEHTQATRIGAKGLQHDDVQWVRMAAEGHCRLCTGTIGSKWRPLTQSNRTGHTDRERHHHDLKAGARERKSLRGVHQWHTE